MSKIVVCYKWVRDEADIRVNADRSVDFSRAGGKISDYDRNAIQAAMQCAGENDQVVALTFGDADAKKSIKDALSRGPDQAYWINTASAATADGSGVAKALAAAIRKIDDVKLVICGEGASDTYAHEVGPRLATLLDLPVISSAASLAVEGTALVASRVLRDYVERVQVELPAVVTVMPQAAEAIIPGLKMVLAAGKKPVTEFSPADLGLEASTLVSKAKIDKIEGYLMARKNVVFKEGDTSKRIQQLVDALNREGVLA